MTFEYKCPYCYNVVILEKKMVLVQCGCGHKMELIKEEGEDERI